MSIINVLLVDDQVILREGIKRILEQDNEIRVVGLADNGKSAFLQCKQLKPDLVMMDIIMPISDGIEGTRLIKEQYPDIKIIMLTTFNDDEKIKGALNFGADGYILKDISPEELIMAVKSTMKGLRIMHASTYDQVVKQIKANEKFDFINSENSCYEFSEKELEILRLLTGGKSNKEIADAIFLSEGTVRNLISDLLHKLNLRDRVQLAVFAVKNDIV